MPSLVSDNFRLFAAEQFIESLEEPYTSVNNPVTDETSAVAQAYRSKVYLFIGRSYDWNDLSPSSTSSDGIIEKYDNSGYSDLFAPDPIDNVDEINDIYDDMISLKRITRQDVSQVIKRVNWTQNIIYDMYRHNYGSSTGGSNIQLSASGQSNLFDCQFYVMNKNFEVYKCIYNGQVPESPYQFGKPSTTEPTGTGDSTTNIVTTADGYKWKYMYTLTIADYIKFVSTDFMPVKVDSTVKANAVDGSINQVIIKNRGSGLATPSGSVFVPIIGDGTTAAVVSLTISGGQITSAEIAQAGAGYTYGNINLAKCYSSLANAIAQTGTVSNYSGGNSQIEVIIPPKGGHGYDPFYELGAYRVMINKSLDFLDGLGDIPVDMEFRRFGLISDPEITSGGTDFTSTSASVCKAIKLQEGDNTQTFQIGEIITQSSTGAKGRVIHWDPVNKIIKYYQNRYISQYQTTPYEYKLVPFSGTGAITGANGGTLSPSTSYNSTLNGMTFSSGYANAEIKRYSGKVLYVENRKPIIRSNDQIEDIKLVIEF